jgi:bifunctional non-homologous end joining protein LigD
VEPCLPRPAKEPPAGPGWIHEIKHDGFRILARDAKGIRLFTRNGYDFTARFPKIVEAVASLGVRSCVIDGEAIVVDERGRAEAAQEFWHVLPRKELTDSAHPM